MATTYTLTGGAADLGLDALPDNKIRAYVRFANVSGDAILDTDTSTLLLGKYPLTFVDGVFSVTLPSTAVGAGYDPDGGFYYALVFEYRDAVPGSRVEVKRTEAFELTADSTLTDALSGSIVLTSVSPADYASFAASLEQTLNARDTAVAAAATATAPTDAMIAGRIEDGASLTAGALLDTIVTEATPIADAASARARTGRGIETLTNGALVFIDDDGNSETWTKTRAVFNAKSQHFVAGVPSGIVGTPNYMTLAQVQQLQAEGHEIASHLVNYNVGVGSGSFSMAHIGDSQAWFAERGVDVDHLVWVGGSYTTAAINEAKKFYRSASSVEKGRNTPPINQFAIKRYAVGSMWSGSTADTILENGSQTQYNAMVDLAKSSNTLVVAMMHNWEPAFDATQQSRLEAMIDYAVAQGVPILTMRQAIDRFGNSLDLGTATNHVRVGADGLQSFKDVRGTLAFRDMGRNPAGITAASLGTDFPKGVVSSASFTLASASGFPTSHAGTLITNYLDDQYTITQWWYPYNTTGEAWFRYWRGDTSAWRPWKQTSWIPTGSVNINVPVQAIAAGAVVEIRTMHPAASFINGLEDTIVGSPVGGLETGLMHSVAMWTDKTVIIRLHNPTGALINTVARNWRISVLD